MIQQSCQFTVVLADLSLPMQQVCLSVARNAGVLPGMKKQSRQEVGISWLTLYDPFPCAACRALTSTPTGRCCPHTAIQA
jgi:hypothetical protein